MVISTHDWIKQKLRLETQRREEMDYFEDYKDMLQLFNKYNVKYLVVGAYAMGNYGYSRHTLDIDVWIEKSVENAKNIQKAFNDFPVPYEIQSMN